MGGWVGGWWWWWWVVGGGWCGGGGAGGGGGGGDGSCGLRQWPLAVMKVVHWSTGRQNYTRPGSSLASARYSPRIHLWSWEPEQPGAGKQQQHCQGTHARVSSSNIQQDRGRALFGVAALKLDMAASHHEACCCKSSSISNLTVQNVLDAGVEMLFTQWTERSM